MKVFKPKQATFENPQKSHTECFIIRTLSAKFASGADGKGDIWGPADFPVGKKK